jgi:hypothetical protein
VGIAHLFRGEGIDGRAACFAVVEIGRSSIRLAQAGSVALAEDRTMKPVSIREWGADLIGICS